MCVYVCVCVCVCVCMHVLQARSVSPIRFIGAMSKMSGRRHICVGIALFHKL